MGGLSDHVFGYGSLAGDLLEEGGAAARLTGFRRVWGVAADNSRALPGYKRYLDPDGEAPEVFVAFLDVVEDPAATVNGLLAPVTADALRALDRRERNYDRVEVSASIESPPAGRVWTYVGSADGRARLDAGVAAGTAVIQQAYLDRVLDAFRTLGDGHHAEFLASSNLDHMPVLNLERVDLPPAEPAP